MKTYYSTYPYKTYSLFKRAVLRELINMFYTENMYSENQRLIIDDLDKFGKAYYSDGNTIIDIVYGSHIYLEQN